MINEQLNLEIFEADYKKADVLKNIKNLIGMYKLGKLGGEVMPEDARPDSIKLDSVENYHFLTLPMALNYQRNSYKLWEAAAKTFIDENTRDVFYPEIVIKMSADELRQKLLKHKLALQPMKHIDSWARISRSIHINFQDDIRNLFTVNENDIIEIKKFVQEREKKSFPYLSGHKIFNYWLHVIETYTPTKFVNRHEITVAPDTHVIQGTLKLGLIEGNIDDIAQDRIIVSDAWKVVLSSTDIFPIDIHTPLWLWSKKGFPKIEEI